MIELRGLRVCFVAGTLGQGGAERQLYYMARVLIEHGGIVEVLSLTKGEYWEKELGNIGAQVRWIGGHKCKLLRLLRLIKELRRIRPDVVQSVHFYINAYVGLAGRILGVASVGAIRSNFRAELQDVGRLMSQACLMLPGVVAANSKNAIDNAQALGIPAKGLYFLANVVDTEKYFPRKANGIGANKMILAAGRLLAMKRMNIVLKVHAELKKRGFTGMQTTIAGEGPMQPALIQLAAQLGLNSNEMHLCGAVADMAPLYQQASVFLHTSEYEGAPNVVLEAMACGVPVVGFRVAGVEEIIQHEITGLLAPDNDIAALTENAARILSDPAFAARIAAAGCRFVETERSLSILPRLLGETYTRAIAAQSGAGPCAA